MQTASGKSRVWENTGCKSRVRENILSGKSRVGGVWGSLGKCRLDYAVSGKSILWENTVWKSIVGENTVWKKYSSKNYRVNISILCEIAVWKSIV